MNLKVSKLVVNKKEIACAFPGTIVEAYFDDNPAYPYAKYVIPKKEIYLLAARTKGKTRERVEQRVQSYEAYPTPLVTHL